MTYYEPRHYRRSVVSYYRPPQLYTRGKSPPVLIKQKAVWASDPMWKLWGREKSPITAGELTTIPRPTSPLPRSMQTSLSAQFPSAIILHTFQLVYAVYPSVCAQNFSSRPFYSLFCMYNLCTVGMRIHRHV